MATGRRNTQGKKGSGSMQPKKASILGHAGLVGEVAVKKNAAACNQKSIDPQACRPRRRGRSEKKSGSMQPKKHRSSGMPPSWARSQDPIMPSTLAACRKCTWHNRIQLFPLSVATGRGGVKRPTAGAPYAPTTGAAKGREETYSRCFGKKREQVCSLPFAAPVVGA